MKYITKILVLLTALMVCVGCFKEEKQGTRMRIALYSQNVEEDPILRTTSDIEGYAFWVGKGTNWEVKTWEDALERRITNVDRPSEVLTQPDVEATYDVNAEYQLTYELWATHAFMVVVDKTNRIYATRFYETPMNLPVVTTQLHLYAWRKSGKANGWDVTNPFPDDAREPLVPVENEEEEENTEGENTEGENTEGENTAGEDTGEGEDTPTDEPQDNITDDNESTEDSTTNDGATDDGTGEDGGSATEPEDNDNEATEDTVTE